MKPITLLLTTLLTLPLLTSCAASRGDFNSIHKGMSRTDVEALIGPPGDSSYHDDKGQCSHYDVWKDFWNRKQGDYSDRYYVCYKNGKVSSYGRTGD